MKNSQINRSEILKQQLKSIGITGYRLCKEWGISTGTWSKWVNGVDKPSNAVMACMRFYVLLKKNKIDL